MGLYPLHSAVNKTETQCLSLLLKEKYVVVNVRDQNGQTALHQAAVKSCKESIKILLKNRQIDPTIHDNNGKTAYDCAVQSVKNLVPKERTLPEPQDFCLAKSFGSNKRKKRNRLNKLSEKDLAVFDEVFDQESTPMIVKTSSGIDDPTIDYTVSKRAMLSDQESQQKARTSFDGVSDRQSVQQKVRTSFDGVSDRQSVQKKPRTSFDGVSDRQSVQRKVGTSFDGVSDRQSVQQKARTSFDGVSDRQSVQQKARTSSDGVSDRQSVQQKARTSLDSERMFIKESVQKKAKTSSGIYIDTSTVSKKARTSSDLRMFIKEPVQKKAETSSRASTRILLGEENMNNNWTTTYNKVVKQVETELNQLETDMYKNTEKIVSLKEQLENLKAQNRALGNKKPFMQEKLKKLKNDKAKYQSNLDNCIKAQISISSLSTIWDEKYKS